MISDNYRNDHLMVTLRFRFLKYHDFLLKLDEHDRVLNDLVTEETAQRKDGSMLSMTSVEIVHNTTMNWHLWELAMNQQIENSKDRQFLRRQKT